MYFRIFVIIFPWKRAESPFTQGCFVPSFVEISPACVGFWRRKFLNFVNVFLLFRSYFLMEKGGALHLNFNYLDPRMFCVRFGWNLLSGSGEEDVLNFVNAFSLICYYLPLEKDGTFHLKELESHSSKDALYQVYLKLVLQ